MTEKSSRGDLNQILSNDKFSLTDTQDNGYGQIALLLDELVGELIDLGDHYQSIIEKEVVEEERDEAYFFHYEVVFQIKHLLLLYRDIEFEYHKAKNLLLENRLSQADLANYWDKSLDAIQKAKKEFAEWHKKRWSRFRNDQVKIRSRWEKQSTPWLIYRDQFELIISQSKKIQENALRVGQLSIHFRDIRQLLSNALKDLADRLDQIESHLLKLVDWLEGKSPKSTAQIVNFDKNLSVKSIYEEEQMQVFLELKPLIDTLKDKQTLYIDTKDGLLIELDIDLKKRATGWLEGEIFPQLIELYELASRASHSFAFCLTNIRNRALLSAETKADSQTLSDCQLIAKEELIKISDFKQALSGQADRLSETLEKFFQITNVFHKNEIFLPLSIQNTLRQFGAGRSKISQLLASKFQSLTSGIRHIISNVEKEEESSTLQKVVRYIDQRQPDPKNHHYTSIFLSKGFVGASFAVDRISEMESVQDSVEKWRKGYRGSVLLTGQRFCGKTFFGDWAAARFFPSKKLIRISPGAEMQYSGRKIRNTYSLSDVFDFLKKFALKDKPFIWIDDLELWQDEKDTLFENLDALLKFVDLNSHRCFIMASIGNWNLKHFRNQLDFKQTFQTIIDLNAIPTEEIYRAILIRHGATYRKILTAEMQEMTSREYKQRLNKIVKVSRNNIGEVFQWWSSSVRYLNDKEVIGIPFYPYIFPLQLTDEQRLVLRQILLFRRTDEYTLSRQFGVAFNQKYTYHLRRMLNNGMLTRQPDGTLEVTDCLTNILGNHIFEN